MRGNAREQFRVLLELLVYARHARGELPHAFELFLQALVHHLNPPRRPA